MKIGIDIGGSHIGIALVNEKGKIIEKIEQDIKVKKNIEKYVVDYVDNAIEKLTKNVDIEEIGIAAPGKPEKTIITNLVNLKLEKIDFKKLEDKYKVKVKCINDAKAAAIAEKEYGALKNYKDCAFLCLGTGIGGAIFLDNRLLKATRNPGFEIGHMIINKNGIQCNCGKKGCFETYCSMKRWKTKIEKVLHKICNTLKITDAIMLKQLLKENIENEEIQKIIDEYINNLIIGLSNIIDIFEPEAICLGGSFVYFEDILYEKLVKEMQDRRYVFNKKEIPKIVLAKLKNDAGIIGATLIP